MWAWRRRPGRRASGLAEWWPGLGVGASRALSTPATPATPRPRAPPSGRSSSARPARAPRSADRGRPGAARARARHAAASNGPQYVPATPASASGWIPTGVASTGTSQASASSTASPKPSRSEGTSTALAALTHSGTSAGCDACRASAAPRRPRPARARSWRFSGRAGSAGNSRYGPLRVEAEGAPGLRARDRPEAPHVDAAGEHRAGRRRTAHPGTVRSSGSDTAATRSSSGSAASVIARERGCARSVPCRVTARVAAVSRERRPGRQPEMRVHDVEAVAAVAPPQGARRRGRTRPRRPARTRTARARRPGSATAPRPGRARSCRAPGAPASGTCS